MCGEGLRSQPHTASAFLSLLLLLLGLSGCAARQSPSSTDPPDPPQRAVRQAAALVHKDPAASLAAFEALLAQQPRSPLAHRGVQDARRQLLSAPEFLALYRSGVDGRGNAMDHYLLGRALIDRPDEAKKHFQEARSLDPLMPWSVAGLAYILEQEGDLFRTVELYQEALAVAPHSALLRHLSGTLYLRLQLPVDAQRQLHVALALDPDNPEVWASLGHADAGMRRYRRARQIFEAVLVRRPKLGPIHLQLAALLITDRCPARADEFYREGLRLGEARDTELEASIRALLLVQGEHDELAICVPDPWIPRVEDYR